jgi:Glycosyl hydrolases family 39
LGPAALSLVLAAAAAGPVEEERGRGDPAAARLVVDARSPELLREERFALGQGGLQKEPMFREHVEAVAALRPETIRLFVQEYYSLCPSRGVFRFEALDRSLEDIRRAGARPLLSLAMKPRALFPALDQDRVHPESYEAWEELVEALVRHVDLELRFGPSLYEVANEPDIGEAGGCPSRFRADDYATFYEHTARAVLRGDREARVGGPALAGHRSPILPALLEACSRRGLPLSFVSWHLYSNDPLAFAASVKDVKRLLAAHPALKPELVIDEWNMSLSEPRLEPAFQPAFVLETRYQTLLAGLDRSAYYHIRDRHVVPDEIAGFLSPAGTREMVKWWNATPQYDGLFDFEGRPRPAYSAFRLLAELRGARLPVESTAPELHALAARDPAGGAVRALLFSFALRNPSATQVELCVLGLEGGRWEVRRTWLDASAAPDAKGERLRREEPRPLGAGGMERLEVPPYGACLVTFEER